MDSDEVVSKSGTPQRPASVTVASPPPLPPRDIQPGVSPWRALAPRLLVPIIFALVLVLALNHRSSGIIGGIIAVAVMGAIIGIEVPLLLRSQRRRQAERLRKLPNGAFYACRGSTSLPEHRIQVTGNMIFDQNGITFTPLRNTHTPLIVHWSEVVRLHLGRSRSQPLAGSLVLDKSDGTKQTFIVRAWGGLSEVLASAP
jgi:hypothetical protein